MVFSFLFLKFSADTRPSSRQTSHKDAEVNMCTLSLGALHIHRDCQTFVLYKTHPQWAPKSTGQLSITHTHTTFFFTSHVLVSNCWRLIEFLIYLFFGGGGGVWVCKLYAVLNGYVMAKALPFQKTTQLQLWDQPVLWCLHFWFPLPPPIFCWPGLRDWFRQMHKIWWLSWHWGIKCSS